jgi:hypothetical protein
MLSQTGWCDNLQFCTGCILHFCSVNHMWQGRE